MLFLGMAFVLLFNFVGNQIIKMRTFIVVFLMISILGCKQNAKEEIPEFEENEAWYFWSVDWHPKKDEIVLGGSNDTFFKFVSSKDYNELDSYPYRGTITKTRWHPSKNKLAVSVQDGKSNSMILNIDTDEKIELDTISNEGARALRWNRSGDLLAVGDYEGFLTVFDENGQVLKRKQTGQKSIIGLDWHPDEDLIVAIGEKITFYNYEIDSLYHVESVDYRSEEINVLILCVAWHPNGKFFVTGDYGDFQHNYPPLLQYWTYDGKRIKAIEESKAEYRNLAWSNDGKLLATASEKIRLWNEKGDLVAEKMSEYLLQGIDWSEDGSTIVATDEKRKVIFWDRDLKKVKELQY